MCCSYKLNIEKEGGNERSVAGGGICEWRSRRPTESSIHVTRVSGVY